MEWERRLVRRPVGMRLNTGVAALLAAVTMWGTAYAVTKALLEDAGPMAVTVLRFGIAYLVLAPVAARRGLRPVLSLRPDFLLFGLTGVAVYFGLTNVGLLYTSAGSAALIQAGIPAATAVLAALALGERLSRARLGGVLLSVLGVAVVAGGAAPDDAGAAPLVGNALVVGGVLGWAAYTVQGRKLSVGYPPLVATAASFGAGLLLLLPLAGGELLLRGAPSPSGRLALGLLYLGIGPSALGYLLWNRALATLPASVVAPYANLIPVVGLLAGALALSEDVGAAQLMGGALTLAGVWLSGRA